MNWTSMTFVSRSSVGSVLLAAGLLVGCGDDGGNGVVVGDAGSDAAATETSGAADTSDRDPAPTDDTSEGAGQSTQRETSAAETVATEDTSQPAQATEPDTDAGDGEPSSELDGSVTEGSSSEPVLTTEGVVTSAADESTVTPPCGNVGELCCAATEGNPRGTCNEGYQCNNPAGGGLSNSECIVAPLDAGACGGEGEVCCATGGGFVGTCDEGYACDNPPGSGLTNSTCVVETVTDATGDTNTGAATSASETSGPVDTSAPVETSAPAETSAPVDTSAPSETSPPVDTSAPVETSDASVADAGETDAAADASADAGPGQ